MFIFYNIYFIFSQTPTDVKMYSSDIHSPEIYSTYDIRLHIISMKYDLLFTSQQRPYHRNIMVVHRRTQVTTTGCSCGRWMSRHWLFGPPYFCSSIPPNILDHPNYILYIIYTSPLILNKKSRDEAYKNIP